MVQFHAITRRVADGHCAICDRGFHRIFKDLAVSVNAVPIGEVFLEVKVRNGGAEMHADCSGQRACADMGLHLQAIGFPHGSDFTGFQNAACIADIGLQNVNTPAFQQISESVAGVQSFPNCQALGNGIGNLP